MFVEKKLFSCISIIEIILKIDEKLMACTACLVCLVSKNPQEEQALAGTKQNFPYISVIRIGKWTAINKGEEQKERDKKPTVSDRQK